MFGYQSSELFGKKTEFSNSQNFCKKVWKKFGNLSSDINQNCTSISKISNKTTKSLLFNPVFESKNPVFGSKSLVKFRKCLETGFSEHSEFLEFLEISEISEIVLFRTFQKLQKNDVKLQL